MTAKHAMFFALFAQGEVAVYLDGRRPGVVLPGVLPTLPIVVLTYGPALPVPVVDLRLEETGIGATLSFNRVPSPTFVPWDAVWALAGPGGAIEFAGDIPPEVIASRADPSLIPGPEAARPRFTLVAPEEGGAAPTGETLEQPPRAAPALRVVKMEALPCTGACGPALEDVCALTSGHDGPCAPGAA
jgi:hypothetical protein